MTETDTIYAPATARGRAAVAVVRVSGPRAGETLAALTGRALPPARRAVLRRLVSPETGEALDEALVLWMPGPRSFTGEDSAELHCHGGLGVVEGVLAALGGRPGLRLARPGEFSRRAVETGRLDLASAEALADLVDAETAAQRRQALRLAGGALAARTETWRAALLDALASLEADLDFSDERDVADHLGEGAVAPALARLVALRDEMDAALRAGRAGERLREGLVVALVGAPNAGKSSLLNALAGRDAAIVSPVPGTTRDAIEVRMEVEGLPLLLIDTAGLRDTDDPVEREGVARARRAAARADVVLHLVAVDGGLSDETTALEALHRGDPAAPPASEDEPLILRVLSKADLATRHDGAWDVDPARPPNNARRAAPRVEAVPGEVDGWEARGWSPASPLTAGLFAAGPLAARPPRADPLAAGASQADLPREGPMAARNLSGPGVTSRTNETSEAKPPPSARDADGEGTNASGNRFRRSGPGEQRRRVGGSLKTSGGAPLGGAEADLRRSTSRLDVKQPEMRWTSSPGAPLGVSSGDPLRSGRIAPSHASAAELEGGQSPDVMPPRLPVSALTGAGLDTLRAALAEAARARLAGAESALVVRARQREGLAAAREALDRAVAALEGGLSPEFAAEDLRLCLRRLDWLTGRLSLDGVLDRVFSTFCIGK